MRRAVEAAERGRPLDSAVAAAGAGTRSCSTDRDVPTTPRVFQRGNPGQPGRRSAAAVRRSRSPARIAQPFATGSGRLELARAIVDPANPLTARVIVNRVWMHHFGAGLVRTPSDFGTRAEPPSHPELLDWLASRFVEDGWTLKKLHRRIMLSADLSASRRRGPADRRRARQAPSSVDPENRLLWRMNERRLSFEEMRDSLLAAAGELDRTVGGRPGDLFAPHVHAGARCTASSTASSCPARCGSSISPTPTCTSRSAAKRPSRSRPCSS